MIIKSKLLLTAAVVMGYLNLISCERLRDMPNPEGVPKGAVYDRRVGMWSYRSPENHFNMYYSDGTIALDGQYEKSGRSGIWKTFSPKGNFTVSAGSFLNDWRDGVWKFNDDQGNPYLTVEYKKEPKRSFGLIVTSDYGNENGPYILYYPDGRIQEEGNYYSGFLEGPVKRYHRNGKTAMEGRYNKDEKTGTWKYYYYEGTIEKEIQFLKNQFHGSFKVYYPDGTLYNESFYENGILKKGPVIHPVKS